MHGEQLVIGRIVRYVLADADLPDEFKHRAGEVIPAHVTRVLNKGVLNLTGMPDSETHGLPLLISLPKRPHTWPPRPGTWHWPKQAEALEREIAKQREKQTQPEPAGVADD